MSHALKLAGNKIPFTRGQTLSGANKDWYFYRVSDLDTYLTGLLGSPDIIGTKQSDFEGHQGIIFFQVTGWSDATGHFTLWNGSEVALGSYWDQAYNIKLWKID